MSNLYFCQSINRGTGILRAVLSWEEGSGILNRHSARYVGQQFPTANQDDGTDFALLRIFEEESNDDWRAGFYRIDGDIMQMEESVQACTARPGAA
jgi:hypothetical protein